MLRIDCCRQICLATVPSDISWSHIQNPSPKREEKNHHQYLCGVKNAPEQLSHDLIRGYWLIIIINNNFHTQFLIYISVYIYWSDLNMITYNTMLCIFIVNLHSMTQHDIIWAKTTIYLLSWIIQKYLDAPIFGKSDYQWLEAWKEMHLRNIRKWNDSAGGGGQQQKTRWGTAVGGCLLIPLGFWNTGKIIQPVRGSKYAVWDSVY